MTSVSTFISCTCGACYERCEVILPIKDVGIFECDDCGQKLDWWHGKRIPTFRRVGAPVSKKATSAA